MRYALLALIFLSCTTQKLTTDKRDLGFVFDYTNSGTPRAIVSWNKNTEPDILKYRCYVSNELSNLGNSIFYRDIMHPDTSIVWLGLGLSSGDMFHWAIRAFDTSGNFSDISKHVSFRFKANPDTVRGIKVTVEM